MHSISSLDNYFPVDSESGNRYQEAELLLCLQLQLHHLKNSFEKGKKNTIDGLEKVWKSSQISKKNSAKPLAPGFPRGTFSSR